MDYGYSSRGFSGILSGALIFCIIILIAFLILYIYICHKMCEAVDAKGYNSASEHIFAICFWFGLFGFLYALALPDLKLQRLIKSIADNNKEPIHQEKKVQQEIKAHNPNLETICKNIPGIEL